jgi:hypothetical protein
MICPVTSANWRIGFRTAEKRPEALALEREMVFTWVWIGSREDYDRLIG